MGIAATDYTLKLAVFHTIFNSIGILVMIPFIGQLVDFLTRLMPEKQVSVATTKYLNPASEAISDTAIESIRKETLHLYDNAFTIIAHGLNLHKHDILSKKDPEAVIKQAKKPISIDIDDRYNRNVKGLYGDILAFIGRAQTQMTAEHSNELFELRTVGRDIVEAIKNTKHLHKNLSRYIISNNPYIRGEYNKIRIQLLSVLRRLEKTREGGDILELDHIKLEIEANDTTANGTLERLIHEGKISAEMATSLMNDSSYAQHVTKKLVKMGEILFAKGDIEMKTLERSLILDKDEVKEVLESQKHS